MEKRRKGNGDEKSPAFPEPDRLQNRPEGTGRACGWDAGIQSCFSVLPEQERMFVFAEQPEHARYIWALLRPCLPELRLTEMKQLRLKSQSLGIEALGLNPGQERLQSQYCFLEWFLNGALLTFWVGFFPHTGQEV